MLSVQVENARSNQTLADTSVVGDHCQVSPITMHSDDSNHEYKNASIIDAAIHYDNLYTK